MDDVSRLLFDVSVRGARGWTDHRLSLSVIEHEGALPRGRSSRISPPHRTGTDHHSVFYMAELSRASRQHEVPENDDVHVSEPGGAVRAGRCNTPLIRGFPPVLQSRATDFPSAGLASGALAAFRLRVCGEMRGGGQPGFS